MIQTLPSYSTAILCGGKSTRMKTDKALTDWNGQPMACFIAGGFPYCDDVFLSVAYPEQFDIPGIRMVADKYTDSGPLAGLASSLEAAKYDILFITTCDAPLTDERAADIMVKLLDGYDAVVPRTDGHSHPLTAVYRRSVIKKAVSCLENGLLKMNLFLKELDVNYISAGILPYGDDTLTNLNTPEELERFTQKYRNR